MIKHFDTIKVAPPYTIGNGAVICPIDRISKINDTNYIIPIGYI